MLEDVYGGGCCNEVTIKSSSPVVRIIMVCLKTCLHLTQPALCMIWVNRGIKEYLMIILG